MPTPPKAVCTGVYKPPALLVLLASWARKSLWDLVVIPGRRGEWWQRGGMQLSAKGGGHNPGCSAPAHAVTLGCQHLLLSQTPRYLCIPPFSGPYRLPGTGAPCLFGVLLWECGERAGAAVAAAFPEEDSSYFLFFPFLVYSKLTPACRSSCLDEYLPKSLRFLAVSLQKAQHHLYGNGRLSQKCFGSNQLN